MKTEPKRTIDETCDNRKKLVFIAAVSSDIGRALAQRYIAKGHRVVGTYRQATGVESTLGQDSGDFIACDVGSTTSITKAANDFHALRRPWDLFISAVGDLTPIGPMLELNGEDWAKSVHINGAAQLQLLQALLPFGAVDRVKQVAFLVGGGVNGPFPNYSAYCLGKLLLIKACELIDSEYDDVHAVAVGTGWVDTKIHRQTIQAGSRAGYNMERTADFLKSQKSTPIDDIFGCLNWCFSQDRKITGGRNFSVVHDDWRGGSSLSVKLAEQPDRYKLRRSGN